MQKRAAGARVGVAVLCQTKGLSHRLYEEWRRRQLSGTAGPRHGGRAFDSGQDDSGIFVMNFREALNKF